MAKQRRALPKSNSVEGLLQAADDSLKTMEIRPTRPLGKKAAPIFVEIISRKTFAEWTPLAIRDATHLAEVTVDRDEVRNAVKKKRLVLTTTGLKRNPLAIDLFRLEAEIRALQRHLKINPASDSGPPQEVRGKRLAEVEARAVHQAVEDADSPFLPFMPPGGLAQ